MKLFSILLKSLSIMGIGQQFHTQNRHTSRAINAFVMLVFSFFSLSTIIKIFIENELNAIIECFFISMTCLLNLVTYSYVLRQKMQLFNLIDELEVSIQESNYIKKKMRKKSRIPLISSID